MLRVLAARVRGRSRDWSKKSLEIVLIVAPRDKREARQCDVTLKSRQPFSYYIKKHQPKSKIFKRGDKREKGACEEQKERVRPFVEILFGEKTRPFGEIHFLRLKKDPNPDQPQILNFSMELVHVFLGP